MAIGVKLEITGNLNHKKLRSSGAIFNRIECRILTHMGQILLLILASLQNYLFRYSNIHLIFLID